MAESSEADEADEAPEHFQHSTMHESLIQRSILNQKGYGTGTDTIDRLCQFFGCRVEDLMEHLPEANEASGAGN